MKALRKCACVTVQLVVTAALLFQQCPVQAIALGLERGSDYVEIPASEEGTGAENDSSDASSNDGNSNEAAPASPEKDEAASGADGAVGTDNAKQNTQRDGDATNSGDAAPASAPDEELVWNRLGTLEWSKDANKNVILRPADGAQSGSYEGEVEASQIFGYDIISFSIQGQVTVSSIIFRQCTELASARLSGLTLVGNSMRGMFMRCHSLNSISFFGVEAPSVTDMSSLFSECTSLENVSFGGLNAPMAEDFSGLFGKCASLKSVNFQDVIFPHANEVCWMFYNCSNLEEIDLRALGTGTVSVGHGGLMHLFDGCTSLRAVKLPNLDLSKATSLEYMFNDCRALHEIDLTSLDTSSVVDMSSMFAGCDSLVSVSLSKKFSFGQISDSSKKPCFPSGKYGRWISSVDGIAYSSDSIPSSVDSTYSLQDEKAILDCWNQVGSCVWRVLSKDGVLVVKPLNGSFGSIDFRSDVYPDYELWLRYKSEIKEARFVGDIKLIGDLDRRFSGCSNLCSIDFGSANTSEVTSFSSLFEDCRSLNQITLGSGFVSKPGITCRLLFPDTGASSSGFWRSSADGVCYSYDQIPSGVSATYRAVKSVDSSQWNSCGSCLWSVDESGTLKIKPSNGTSGYLSTSFRWRDVKPEKIKEVKTYGIIELPGSSERMFDGLANVVSMDLSAFDFSKCKTLEGMFFNCRSLKRIKWGDPDTSSVIDMSDMFRNCSSLESIDLGIYETNQLNNVSYMFYGCSSLSNLNESSFDTSHVTKMAGFFPESSRLQSVSFGSKFKLVGKVDLPRAIITPSDTEVPIKWHDGSGADYDCNMIPAGFNIPVSAKAALSTDYFAIDLSDVVYTGEPISKDISCVVGYDLEDICSVELKDNVNVGVASIVLTGKGLFSGEISYGFNIVKADPDRPVLKTFDAIYGQKLSDIYLPSGFEWQDPGTDVGDPGVNSFECNWEGDSNHNGLSDIEVKVRVTRPLEASMFSVDAKGLAYTGSAHEPAVSSEVVPEGSFSVSYRDNVAAGKAIAVVKGSGFYTGTCEVPFTIAKAKPSYKTPSGVEAVYGQKLSDVKLPEGFSWEDPSLSVGDPGENTFKCRYAAPDENHTGAEGIEVKVRVTRPVEPSMFSVDADGLVYTGKAHEPAVSSSVVPEGSFTVSYRDNTAAGKAAAVVKGSGFYTGTCEVPFSIAKAKPAFKAPTGLEAVYGQNLSDVKLPEGFTWEDPSLSVGDPGENAFKCNYAAPDGNHTGADGIEVKVRVTRPVEASMFSADAEGLVYTGKAHEPAVSSKVVPEGSFSVSYRDNVKAGKAVSVVKGSGFYTGTCEVPFTIAKAKPSFNAPTGLKAVYGQKLSDVKLPEGFSWEDFDARVDWYGTKAMKAVFVPSDAENYEVVKGIEIPVFVGRKVISVPSIDDLVYSGSIQVPQVDIDGVRIVSNDGGIDAGKYSVELALDDPKLDCWEDGSVGNKTVEYKIVPADINTADIAPISPCLLKDGKAEPGVSVTFGGRNLSVGHDFSVSYSDNEKVGTASATIEGKGNFTGEKTAYFQIAKSDLGDCLVATKRNVYLYKGDTVEPRIFVSFGDASLREGVDYKVAYSGNDAVGIGHATVSGMGEYIGSKTVDFAIVDAIDLGTYCTVHAYDAFYTGDKVCPRVDVRLNTESSDEAYGNGGASRSEDAPVEGRDYTVLFEDNVNPGMGTAIVQGRGRYTGEVRVQFHILRKSDFDLSDCSVLLDPPSNADRYSHALKGGKYSFLYTGSVIEPTVSVSLYNDSGVYVELRNGVDYEVSYRSNTEPGSATVVVRGINGLTGSQTIGFNIVRKLSVADLSLSKYDFEQSVYQLKPGFALAPKLRRSSSFVEGADCILSYANCDKVGNGLVTVTGIGRYTGSVVVEVPIVESLNRSLLSECSFDKIEDQVYTGSEIYPSVVLKNASGAEVDQTMECSLRYSNNVNVGKATVSACESMYYSSYIGGTSTSFNILPADINDAYFAPIGDEIYTGNAIKPDVLVRFNGKTLVKGIDYDLSYSDNVEVGTAHVVVTGKGNFGGKREMTFNIVRPMIEFDQDMVEGKTVSTSWTKKVNVTSYRMVLNRGGMVRIRTSFSRIDTVLCSIQNENGDIIQSWSPSDGGDYGFFALPAGTYYFQYIGSPKSYGGSVYASYSVTPFSEPADTIYEVEDNSGTADGHTIDGDATPIEIGRCFAGSNYYAITGGYGDLDYFKFTVTKRGHYSMSLSTNARLMFALTDSQGHTLDNRDTGSGIVAQSYSDSLTGLDFGTLEPGTYYVLVLSKDKNAIGAAYHGCIFDSSDPAPTKKGVGRVSGNTRYDTMGSLTERGNWAKGGSVVLASGANYPDALAASSLAGGFNGPILLTDPNGLSTSAKDQLELLCPSRVFIVGGNAAVSPAVERQVKELLGSGCAVFRVAGQTRYETSLVAAEINPKSSDTVIVATGGNYADALSVSPYAFASGSPVVLCDKSSGLTAGAMGTIRSKKYSKAVIVGGTAAVPAAVERQLRSAGVKNITRLSGATRYETSTKIADFELESGLGFTMDGVLLATGSNFPDALAAGPLAGRSRSPLLLVDPGASYASGYLSAHRGEVRSAVVVGGASAVPEADRSRVAAALGLDSV